MIASKGANENSEYFLEYLIFKTFCNLVRNAFKQNFFHFLSRPIYKISKDHIFQELKKKKRESFATYKIGFADKRIDGF